MTKKELLQGLAIQREKTLKTTRKDIVNIVYNLVNNHIKDNKEIDGVNLTRSSIGFNLGEIVEVVIKSIFKNKTIKSASTRGFDSLYKGEKYEIKFTTSDACSHAINKAVKVDYYLIVSYTKATGGVVFKVPYSARDEIIVNNQQRVVPNQKVKFIDKDLTSKLFNNIA